jgi:RHS repeat-associated protein
MDSPPSLSLDQLAALTARMEAGIPRESVLAEAGLSPEAWKQAHGAWMARMVREARLKKRALHRQFTDLVQNGDELLESGATSFTWDERGRMAERRTQTEARERVTSYTWTAAGLLSKVAMDDGTVVEFTYDAFARRLKKEVFRETPSGSRSLLRRTRFYWHKNTLLHEVTEAEGQHFERRYHFDDGGEPLAHREIQTRDGERSEGAWVHYVNDPSGFPARLVDGEGRVLGELTRTVWGKASKRDGGPASTPVRFLGQYADAETGLHYNRYRYYDPELGRYISPDPLELLGGQNAFVYGQNSPFSFGDPYGLIYTRIVDSKGKVLREGAARRAQQGREGRAADRSGFPREVVRRDADPAKDEERDPR